MPSRPVGVGFTDILGFDKYLCLFDTSWNDSLLIRSKVTNFLLIWSDLVIFPSLCGVMLSLPPYVELSFPLYGCFSGIKLEKWEGCGEPLISRGV